MRFFKSKLFVCVILLIVAGVLCFWYLPQQYSQQASLVDIVRLKDNVGLGDQITESMVFTETVGNYGLPHGVITEKEKIIGKYAIEGIQSRELLFSDMFANKYTEVDGALEETMTKDDRLITISLSNGATAGGGLLQPGDIIDVMTQYTTPAVYNDMGVEMQAEKTIMELLYNMENVVVYKTLNASLDDIAEIQRKGIAYRAAIAAGEESAEGEEVLDTSCVPAYAVLIVDKYQELILANQELNGGVHLVKHPLEDVTTMDPDDYKLPAMFTLDAKTGRPIMKTQEQLEDEGYTVLSTGLVVKDFVLEEGQKVDADKQILNADGTVAGEVPEESIVGELPASAVSVAPSAPVEQAPATEAPAPAPVAPAQGGGALMFE